ncbi:MAG: polyribonucleotide nucleotidyltransferase [Burkholderiales bacterium]|nr:polyribonucleotide nucleotidyltransferase [Anaerolineae bacterium]
MNGTQRFTAKLGDSELVIETGKLAQQAGGAVTVTLGDTVVFATATMSKKPREGIDFFPLSVDYEEKLYAAGKIPGSFFRREGRPSEGAILSARLVDRTLRPLFPDDMRNDVQVILTSFSHDQEHHIDILGIAAASAAIMISDIPWNGPVAGVRIGRIDGQLVVNPTIPQMENSDLDLRVSGTADAINMVECGAVEVDEETMLQALKLAHESIQPIIAAQIQMQQQLGKPKSAYTPFALSENLLNKIKNRVGDEIRQILINHSERETRKEALDALELAVLGEYEARSAGQVPSELATKMATDEVDPDDATHLLTEVSPTTKDVKNAFEEVLKAEVRRRIIEDGIRPDGRDSVTIRALAAEVSLIPRVHGSGLFTRGQTQVMTIATLGTPRDSQMLDGLSAEDEKRYLHHYNFPPYSTGETYPLRGPKRREIGHGALAETALRSMIPPEDEFPYTVRLVSEVLSSNGSTSMASVCGSTLALMDAGVPITRPVAGIAMGLIKEGDKVAVLTDIQGMEDHLGDMDFKVAGTTKGITALQMDIKISGVSDDIMRQALAQALDARLKILEVMHAAIAEPRAELSDYAPRITTIHIDPEKIGAVIGPGGKVIRGIQERNGVKIDIEEDGTVFVAGDSGPSTAMAVDEIRALVEDAEIGRVYTGRVTRVEPYGAFVEFLPSREGLVHISQLADYRVTSVEDEVQVGDELMVMVTDVDDGGKVRLSRQAVLEGWTAEEARSRDRRPSGGGGNRGGGDRRGGGGGGGDRRGGGGGGGGGPRR